MLFRKNHLKKECTPSTRPDDDIASATPIPPSRVNPEPIPTMTAVPPEVSAMAAHLRDEFPNDIVMPVAIGTKRPMFPHKNGEWTWDMLDSFFVGDPDQAASCDYCVVLHDLLVVDVDDPVLLPDLMSRFPELEHAPTVITKRGRHFWFSRPHEADASGYYDGSGQRVVGIDLKTICSTGTGGIVMIPPSTDKRWAAQGATPRLGMVQPATLELLDAVATPRFDVVDARLAFEDGATVMFNRTRALHVFLYFEPFLTGDLFVDDDAVVPVPCESTTFVELMHLIEHGELKSTPTRDLHESVTAVAQKLGADPRTMRRLRCGLPRFMLDWAETDLEAFDAMRAEREWLKRYPELPDDAILHRIDADVARTTLYDPTTRGEHWLFPILQQQGLCPGAQVIGLDFNEIFARECPPCVANLMRRFPGRVVLAGGAVTGIACKHAGPGSDWDLFLVGMTQEEAEAMIEDVRNCLTAADRVIVTGRAVTLRLGTKTQPITAQIITRLYETKAQVLLGFDLAPCRAACWFDETGRVVFAAAPSWITAVKRMAFPVELSRWSDVGVVRVAKYISKNFHAYVPGARRQALIATVTAASNNVGALFRMETDVMNRLRGQSPWPRARHMMRVLGDAWRGSDYSTVAKISGKIWYIVRAIARFGYDILVGDDRVEMETIKWSKFDPHRKNPGSFCACSPGFYKAFCIKELESALA
jgi:hypothetical protein